MSDHKIKNIKGREIIDSRGNPTVEAVVTLGNGVSGRGMVPSGASTGSFEALELRDNDPNRYNGKGVKKAVNNINTTIAAALKDKDCTDTATIDDTLIKADGTQDKSNLGANAILACSLAAANAAANALNLPLYRFIGGVGANTLPVPMMNILNGGAHASNNIDIQEFMIMPVGAPTFKEGLRYCAEVSSALAGILKQNGFSVSVGDEGGYAPDLKTDTQAIELILEAIEKAGYQPKSDFVLALDAAAGEWQQENGYKLPKHQTKYSTDQLIGFWEDLCQKYPIVSIEDGLGEDDWQGWKHLTTALGHKIQLVGDDLFVTNTSRLQRGVSNQCANAILIKLNQIGTLTETIKAVQMAHDAGYRAIISHRSGETEDTFIADLSVALNTGQIKTGALKRSERVCKYNRLLRIEEELGKSAYFPGIDCFA